MKLNVRYFSLQVKPFGWCLNLLERRFIQDPIEDDNIGKVSPRRYASYTYVPGVVPDPRKYRLSVENSFSGDEKKRFLRKLYQLLLIGHFPFKNPKLFVCGPSNSGKTCWFAPIASIVGPDGVSMVVKEGKFSLQQISEDTQVVVMEEWMACDTGKNDKFFIMYSKLCRR